MKNKNAFSPEDFQSRAEKVKKIEIPESNQQRVIVVPNNEAIGFKFNCYKDEFLRGRVDKYMFDNTVTGAQKICEHVWKQRKLQESSDQQGNTRIYLLIAFLLAIAAIGILIDVVYVSQDMIELYISIAIQGLAAVITLFVAFETLMISPKFIDLETEIKNKLAAFLAQENKTNYLGLGLRWEMHPQFYWLELHINQQQ